MKSLVNRIRPKPLSAYRSVIELRDHSKGKKASMSQKDIRSAVKIAIIDDEKFIAFASLKSGPFVICVGPVGQQLVGRSQMLCLR